MTDPRLLQPLTLRSVTFPNRVWLAPMCQYSAQDGLPDDWHLAHLGARAAGGFGLVLTEATAVVPEGRISPHCTGIWNDAQADAWARVVAFAHARGARIGIQLAHAGRKGSTYRPWSERQGSVPEEDGGWRTVAPSAVAFPGLAEPLALDEAGLRALPAAFADAARRALAAGFDVVELHAAHGYLLHEFLSPLSNHRTDAYGGSLENRARLLVEVVRAVREVWPERLPLFVRFSVTDWLEGGLVPDDLAQVTRWIAPLGVDLVDASSGAVLPADIPVGPGYQVPLARRIREEAGVPVAAVGLISSAEQAEQVLVEGAADAVLLGRAALRDPSWPLRAAHELGAPAGVEWQPQYARGAWR